MIIDCIGCLHGHYPKLEGGDLLIITGDLTKRDELDEYYWFDEWIRDQNYKMKILIAGNHDNQLQKFDGYKFSIADCYGSTFRYLCDSGTEFEGLKIWGYPWTKTFPRINPKCKAFTVHAEEELASKLSLIPEHIDILITHGPCYGILDGIPVEDGSLFHAGSTSLRNIVLSSDRLPKLKIHVFSHIHEQGGKTFDSTLTKFVNCSRVNEQYKPINKPIRVIL